LFIGFAFRGGILNWNKWIRQTHRWLSMAFMAADIVAIVEVAGWAERSQIRSLGAR
jgi:hypothetical protein